VNRNSFGAMLHLLSDLRELGLYHS